MNYRTRVAGAMLAGVLLATAASAQAWAGRGRLSGTVQDADGNPVEGASIQLTLDGSGPDAVSTNGKGRWARAGLGGGNWDVLVSKPGYVSTTHNALVQEYAAPADRVFLKTTLEVGAASATDGSAAALDDGEAAQAAREQLEQGNGLLAAGDYEGAIQVFTEALDALPDGGKAAVLVAVAQAQVQLERDDEALASLERALDPGAVERGRAAADEPPSDGPGPERRSAGVPRSDARGPAGGPGDPRARGRRASTTATTSRAPSPSWTLRSRRRPTGRRPTTSAASRTWRAATTPPPPPTSAGSWSWSRRARRPRRRSSSRSTSNRSDGNLTKRDRRSVRRPPALSG